MNLFLCIVELEYLIFQIIIGVFSLKPLSIVIVIV
jgi:hypothetical protein